MRNKRLSPEQHIWVCAHIHARSKMSSSLIREVFSPFAAGHNQTFLFQIPISAKVDNIQYVERMAVFMLEGRTRVMAECVKASGLTR